MRAAVLAVTAMVGVLSIGATRVAAFSMGEGMATTGIQGTLSGNATSGVVGATKRVKSAVPKMAAPGLSIDDGGSGLASAARRRPGGGSASGSSRGSGGGGSGWKQGAGNWASGGWAGSGGSWAAGGGAWAGGGGWASAGSAAR